MVHELMSGGKVIELLKASSEDGGNDDIHIDGIAGKVLYT